MANLKKEQFLVTHKFSIKINNIPLKENVIYLELAEGMNELLNYGCALITFRNDTLINYSDFCIGMPVIIEIEETKETIQNLVVSGISSNVENAPELSGVLQLYFCNAWLFSKNFRFKSYNGVNSEIVKFVLDDRAYRGERNISVSDNTGKFRYSTASDLEYIEYLKDRDTSAKKCIYSWISRDSTFNYVNTDFSEKVTGILVCDKKADISKYDSIKCNQEFDKSSVGFISSFSIFGDSVDNTNRYLSSIKGLNNTVLQDAKGSVLEYSYSAIKGNDTDKDYRLPYKGSMVTTTSYTNLNFNDDITVEDSISKSAQSQREANSLVRCTFKGTYTNLYAGEKIYLMFLSDSDTMSEQENILTGIWQVESVKAMSAERINELDQSLRMEVSLFRPTIYAKNIENTLNLA